MHDVDGHGMQAGPEDCKGEQILQGELSALYVREGVEQAVDDVSGAYLDPVLVAEARKSEMKFFSDMQVYDRVPLFEMLKNQGKIIKTRWIDVNKGDAQSPNYRSRLVGKEFKTYADDSLYASTPPLEALRLVMSRAATTDRGSSWSTTSGGPTFMLKPLASYMWSCLKRTASLAAI